MAKDHMTKLRTVLFAAIALPAALALAACGDDPTEDAGLPKGDAIAAIKPPAGTAWADTAVETPEGGFRIGNPDAPLKLVEYASHTCSHCAEFSMEASEPLRDKYVASGVLSYEIRNLIRDPLDLSIAVLARCSGPQAFHPLADQAWANFGAMGETIQANGAAYEAAMQKTGAARLQAMAEVGGMIDFFAARGISRDQALQCLSDTAKFTQIAERSDKDSKDLALTGTPSFFLNGSRIEFTTWDAVEPVLKAAGAR